MSEARAGRSMRQAVPTALSLLAAMIICAILGAGAFFVLAVVVVTAAGAELLDAVRKAGGKPSVPLGIMGVLAMMGVAFQGRFAYFGIVLAATMVGAFIYSLRPDRGRNPITDVAWTMLAVLWVGGGGAGAVSLLAIEPGGLWMLFGMVLVAAVDDIGAYFGGTRFGRHKLAPSISPAKSWEGFFFGMATALVGGAVFGYLLPELSALEGFGVGAICSVLAPVGDLIESGFKRELKLKDSSGLLPGHGGFLDRLDAILFCAPAVAVYIRWVLA